MKLETIPFKIDAIRSVAQYDAGLAGSMRNALLKEFIDHVAELDSSGNNVVVDAAERIRVVFALGLP